MIQIDSIDWNEIGIWKKHAIKKRFIKKLTKYFNRGK